MYIISYIENIRVIKKNNTQIRLTKKNCVIWLIFKQYLPIPAMPIWLHVSIAVINVMYIVHVWYRSYMLRRLGAPNLRLPQGAASVTTALYMYTRIPIMRFDCLPCVTTVVAWCHWWVMLYSYNPICYYMIKKRESIRTFRSTTRYHIIG